MERVPPPQDRHSVTKRFEVPWPHKPGVPPQTLRVYLTVGLYDDGSPCELFFWGSTIGEFPHGILSALAMSTSIALQYGCPVEKIVKQWTSTRFPPEGFTGDADFPRCTSLLDLVGQWLKHRFMNEDD